MKSRAIKLVLLFALMALPQKALCAEARLPIVDSCHGQIQIGVTDPRGTRLLEFLDSPGSLPDVCTLQTPETAWAKVTLAHNQCVALLMPNSIFEINESENSIIVLKGSALITVRENIGPGVSLQTKKHLIDLKGGTVKIEAAERDSICRLVGRSNCFVTNRSTGKTSKLLIGGLFQSK